MKQLLIYEKEAAPATTRDDPKGASVRAGTTSILHRAARAGKALALAFGAMFSTISAVWWILSIAYGDARSIAGAIIMCIISLYAAYHFAAQVDKMDKEDGGRMARDAIYKMYVMYLENNLEDKH